MRETSREINSKFFSINFLAQNRLHKCLGLLRALMLSFFPLTKIWHHLRKIDEKNSKHHFHKKKKHNSTINSFLSFPFLSFVRIAFFYFFQKNWHENSNTWTLTVEAPFHFSVENRSPWNFVGKNIHTLFS